MIYKKSNAVPVKTVMAVVQRLHTGEDTSIVWLPISFYINLSAIFCGKESEQFSLIFEAKNIGIAMPGLAGTSEKLARASRRLAGAFKRLAGASGRLA